ncbi:polysaccharide pyruvyl transferase family protein [Maribellus sediminis]|uniref:polysaccharide pyruvyl transferase family protein n=1 Tax=Maribellus sediminis TaxID=2696285 RepID=UPI001431DD15|nr:polysaccharide pyruvyl transferase family protein [Maribellus sediminis]
MIVRIEGVGGVNKGAELMLIAAIEELERRYNDPVIVFCNFNQKSYIRRTLAYLMKKYILKRNSRSPFDEIRSTNRLLETLPLISYNKNMKVDLILDAGGFQFSDQFDNSSKSFSKQIERLRLAKEQGSKIIFLPQAFGPFNDSLSVSNIKSISKYADLFIAREKVSWDYLVKVLGNDLKVKVFTDFTNLVEGEVESELLAKVENRICLIPNTKMMTHTNGNRGKKYVEFFLDLMNMLYELKEPFFLLNHEGFADLKLCKELKRKANIPNIQIVNIEDAKVVKGIIGRSKFVVSSRYHGVASALSQAVPVYATSWSHKYNLLFNDYDIDQGVLNFMNGKESLKIIETALNKKELLEYRQRLLKVIPNVKRQTNLMWDSVFSLI